MTSSIRLTGPQACATLVIEGQLKALEVAANQLGGFLKLEKEAHVVLAALNVLAAGFAQLQREWQGAVVVVSASELPRVTL